ncbi:hypothetical protein AGOR_G00190750 [Albula goreensis]|uniref:ALMS motif domain-containing protein n=1 Tax=Albula goreensis TaxID=1534307 RepID=A0A8T3CUS6_9TELE|nr:hypothetical protein AGOR_G00190750 [Albula goreensis]
MEPVEVHEEESVTRPIVTTPPISRQKQTDELRSVSSSPGSGTHMSSSTSAVSLGEAIVHRAKQGVESWGQLPVEEDVSQLTMASVGRLGQASSWSTDGNVQHAVSIQQGLVTPAQDKTVQQPEDRCSSFQLEFQDSHLSPALPLLPEKSGKLHSLVENTLFHQTDLEFVALKGSPDMSVVSERFLMHQQVSDASQLFPSLVSQGLTAERSLLHQNQLGLTVASLEEANSCCSLSQHTLSPFSEAGEQDSQYTQGALEEVQQEREPCYGLANQSTHTIDEKEQSSFDVRPSEKAIGTSQSGATTATPLLELPQKDVHMSSSSVVSSASNPSVNERSSSRGSTSHKAVKSEAARSSRQEEITKQKKSQQEEEVQGKLDHSRSSLEQEPLAGYRERPLGGASCSSLQQIKTPRRSEILNITTRSSHTQSDNDSDALREQLCSEIDKARRSKSQEVESQPKLRSSRSVTPTTCSLGTHSGRESTVIEVPTGFSRTEGRPSAGFSFERGHIERELSCSGNQTAVDGSFFGSLSQPVSQSTPGVFLGPLRASAQPPMDKLSPIESNPKASHSSTRVAQSSSTKPHLAPTFDIGVRDSSGPGPGVGALRDTSLKSAGKIQALPSLNYMEKVGAWNANQSSGKTFFDDLALRGFSGVSPKKKAFDAISDSLNQMLSQDGGPKRFQAMSASAGSSHSPRRNLATSFSGALSVKEDPGGGSFPDSLPGRSMTQSSLGPVMGGLHVARKPGSDMEGSDSSGLLGTPRALPVQKEHGQSEQEGIHEQGRMDPAGQQEPKAESNESATGKTEQGSSEDQPGAAQLSTRFGLDQFSDISSNRDLSSTLTSSQDSHFERRLAASMGAVSSVVSLEVDNYAPYWAPTPSTPAKEGELNIEERIPMYLHNLGIDQSPSTILTPFVPRGPIREPEFSPTDLCTLKGSTGTPTKSTQPSEVGSPPKGEFSRSSQLSAGSSVSIPLSVDSLQPIMPLFQHSVDRPINESCLQTTLLPLDPVPQGSQHSSVPDPTHHLSDSTDDQAASRVRKLIEKFQPGKVFTTTGSLSSTEDQHQQSGASPIGAKPPSEVSSSSVDQGADSFVGSKTLQEIRKLLGRAESIVSGTSSPSSSPPSPQIGSDDSLVCIKKKLEGFQDSFASSMGNQETPSSLLWGRSSSESVLTSDGLKESSSGGLCRSPRASSHSFDQGKGSLLRSLDSIPTQSAESFPNKSARRSEPEGCSSSVPDRVAPVFISVIKVKPPSPGGGAWQGRVHEVTESPHTESSGSSSEERSQAPNIKAADLVVESDSSSSSSADTLTTRVAALLRNESPATMASSNASTADEDDRRAREWIKLTVSGQQCEQLPLNGEDRQRIEEIKRELLRNTKHSAKSQLSTDTDSSTHSVASRGQPPAHVGQFHALKTAEHQLSHQLQQLSNKAFDSSVQLHFPARQDLEARVQDLVQREGALVTRTGSPPITSITIASCRRSPSPSPSPTLSSTPTAMPLHLGHLATDAVPQPATGGHTLESQYSTTQPKVDITIQVSSETELSSEVESAARISSRSGPRPYPPDAHLSLSESGVQSQLDTLGTRYTTSNGYDTSSTAGEGSGVGSRQIGQGTGSYVRSSFHLDPMSYRPISRSEPNLSSSSSLEPSAAPLHNSTFASGSCSIASPTKKVLSHLHLTLSPKQSNEGSTINKPTQQDRSPRRRRSSMGRGTGVPLDSSARPTSQSPLDMEFSARGHLPPDGHPPANQSAYFPVPRETSSSNDLPEPQSAPLDQVSAKELPVQPSKKEDCETADASVQITTHAPQREVSWNIRPETTFPQSFTSQSRLSGPLGPLSIQPPAVPVLLPYKPHGSPELFYMPQSDAQLSPIRSETTMESTHPGSDDAVPPKFTSEVLGSRDQEEGIMVTTKHTEGIYSKRLTSYNTHQGHRGLRMDVNRPQDQKSHIPSHSLSLGTHESAAQETTPSIRGSRDQWLPEQEPRVSHHFVTQDQREEEEEFAPLQGEATYSMEDLRPLPRPRWHSSQEPRPLGGPDREKAVQDRQDVTTRGTSSHGNRKSLDELWQRYNERRRQRESRPSEESETNLLERLERLSRLIHSNHDASPLKGRGERTTSKRRVGEKRKDESVEVEEGRQKEGVGRRGNGQQSVREAWVEEVERSDESPSLSSTLTESPVSRHHCPAERDGDETGYRSVEADSASTISTIDTARLLRAFGPHRVQVKPGLGRLYSTISRQRESQDHRKSRKRANSKPAPAPAPSESNSTDDSTISTVTPAESVSSGSTLHRRPLDALVAKKTVKLVNKGIQTGDLEIVVNGTRKHTRDVGTTFPSPISARQTAGSSADSGGSKGKEASPHKAHTFMNEKRSRKAQVERYPQGVSWFVPADSVQADAKENQPEPRALSGPGPVWFEPYTKTKPWREPLRERQVQEEPIGTSRRGQDQPITSTESDTKVPPALVPITLQEALATRRPDFVSRSRERVKRLALHVEERRMQSVFDMEREQLFNRPGLIRDPLLPADLPVHRKRVIPRKEMFKRSKQLSDKKEELRCQKVARQNKLKRIYSQLPEVQKRLEEEKRKAEYRSYRLRAQLYKKKITNHVLGRKTPWQ